MKYYRTLSSNRMIYHIFMLIRKSIKHSNIHIIIIIFRIRYLLLIDTIYTKSFAFQIWINIYSLLQAKLQRLIYIVFINELVSAINQYYMHTNISIDDICCTNTEILMVAESVYLFDWHPHAQRAVHYSFSFLLNNRATS